MNAPDWTALLQAVRPELAQPALLTGGSGRLGRELRQLLPGLHAPGRAELDVREPAAWLERERPALIVHAAAFTDVAAAEERRGECWDTNVQAPAAWPAPPPGLAPASCSSPLTTCFPG